MRSQLCVEYQLEPNESVVAIKHKYVHCSHVSLSKLMSLTGSINFVSVVSPEIKSYPNKSIVVIQ